MGFNDGLMGDEVKEVSKKCPWFLFTLMGDGAIHWQKLWICERVPREPAWSEKRAYI